MADRRASDATSFGEVLRALRVAAALTQEELAEAAGVSGKAVGALERGERRRPHPHTVRALAQALGLDDTARARLHEAARAADGAGGAVATAAARAADTGEPPTPLIGRDALVAQVADLLRGDGAGRTALVTLTGPGGVGKTRVALRVAATLAAELDEVVLVRLAAVEDPALVGSAVASAVGVRANGAVPGSDLVVERLAGRRVLLVLDNVEHLLGAAPLVVELAGRLPGLRMLATSRARLRVRGEREVAVAPLALPDVHATPAGALAPALELLLERARAGDPGIRLDEDNVEALVMICRQLEGLPLALELAAAQLRYMDCHSLLARLDRVLGAEGPRDLPARQRTLRAALAWSHDLLPEPERILLRRLPVFGGGFDIDAAESVLADPDGGGTARIDRDDVIVLLGRLVEHSLVVADRGPDGIRYRLLELVRQYARELLAAFPEEEAVLGERHARRYAEVVQGLGQRVRGHDQVRWQAAATVEMGNLRAAMSWALDAGEPMLAARIAGELWPYWWLAGAAVEGLRWSERILDAGIEPRERGAICGLAAAFSYAVGDFPRCARYSAEALEHGKNLDDARARAHGRAGLGLLALGAGDMDTAAQHFVPAHDDFLASGDPSMAATTLSWRAVIAASRGDEAEAQLLLTDALARAERLGDRQLRFSVLHPLASGALAAGDADTAAGLFREGVALADELHDRAGLYHLVEGLAVAEALRGFAERAALLLGAAQAIHETLPATMYHHVADPQRTADARERVVAALGPEAYAAALQRGRAGSPAALAADVGAAPLRDTAGA